MRDIQKRVAQNTYVTQKYQSNHHHLISFLTKYKIRVNRKSEGQKNKNPKKNSEDDNGSFWRIQPISAQSIVGYLAFLSVDYDFGFPAILMDNHTGSGLYRILSKLFIKKNKNMGLTAFNCIVNVRSCVKVTITAPRQLKINKKSGKKLEVFIIRKDFSVISSFFED